LSELKPSDIPKIRAEKATAAAERLISLRVSPHSYLTALLLGTYLSAFAFYLELDIAGGILFGVAWIVIPFLALNDRVAFDGRRLIRTDMRGVGLSESDPKRWDFDALLEDFIAVVDDAGLETFDIFGMSHGVLVAIAFAARYPERVRRLLLFGGYAEGFGVRADPEEISRRETLLNLGRGYAPSDRVSFARMLGALYWPDANNEMMDWFVDRLGTISVLSEQLQDVFRNIDLRPELKKIKAPTLIMHSRGDRIIPASCAESLAGQIAGSKLVLLDSENHIPLVHDAGWPEARSALRSFLNARDRALVDAA